MIYVDKQKYTVLKWDEGIHSQGLNPNIQINFYAIKEIQFIPFYSSISV